jgi:hypothetical protein
VQELLARIGCCNVLLRGTMPRNEVVVSYDEAMAICLLLAEAADASARDELLRDTWVQEARLMIEMILGRTDD